MIRQKQRKGYIALFSLLILAAAALTVGLAVSLQGIDEIQSSVAADRSVLAKAAANTCIEEGLERLRNDFINYSATLPIDDDYCILNISVNGSSAVLSATGTVDIYSQKIKVQVDDDLEIVFWQED